MLFILFLFKNKVSGKDKGEEAGSPPVLGGVGGGKVLDDSNETKDSGRHVQTKRVC